MKSILLICATIFVVSQAKPEGYYRQQYQFQQSSSKYKNDELQEKNEDEGFYSKQGDLEGRHDPKVDEFSSHIQYTNPKLRLHGSEGLTQQTEDAFGQQGIKTHRRPHGQGFISGGDSALNFGTTGTRTGYSYSGSYSFGSANSGQLDSLNSGKTYGVDSKLLSVAQKLQTDLSRQLQEAISKQHEQSSYSHTYSSNTAQMNADLQGLQEELKRNLTLQLQDELRRKYGAQGTRGSFSYSITSGYRNPTANYDTAELTDLTKQVETNLLKQLEEGVKTEYRESSQSSSFNSHSSDSTSNVNGGKRIHYPYRPSIGSLEHTQTSTGNQRIHNPFNPYPRRTDSTYTRNHNVENVDVNQQTSGNTQTYHGKYPTDDINSQSHTTDDTSESHPTSQITSTYNVNKYGSHTVATEHRPGTNNQPNSYGPYPGNQYRPSTYEHQSESRPSTKPKDNVETLDSSSNAQYRPTTYEHQPGFRLFTKPKHNVQAVDSSSNTQYVYDERTRQIYPQSSTPRIYTPEYTHVDHKPKISDIDESLSLTSGNKHTYQTIDSTQTSDHNTQELEVDMDSKPINSYNNNRRTDTTYTSTYHMKPLTTQTNVPLKTVLHKVEDTVNRQMVNEEEIRKMIQSIKKYDNPQSFEFVKIKIRSIILMRFDNILTDELHDAYGDQETRGSFTYSKSPKNTVNPIYKTDDLIDLKESIRNKLKEKIENILNREKAYYETNYTSLTTTNQNQHHEYNVNSGSRPVTVITNPTYSGGGQNKQQVAYTYTSTHNSENSELNTIRNQLQAQLQQQLQDALRGQLQQQQASSTHTSQTYQMQLNDLTEELKRNLTRQLETSLKQHYGEQGQRNGYSYTITTSGGYKPKANYNNQQISDLTKQLEADLTRQLQESLTQQKTYSSYGSSSSSSSTNFKPLIQIDPIQSSTNSRGGKTYSISGSAYVSGTVPVHKYSGSLSSGSQTYNSGVTEDCLQDDPTTPKVSKPVKNILEEQSEDNDSQKTVNQFDQHQTQQKFEDHHLEIDNGKLTNTYTQSSTRPKKPISSSHSISSTQQLINSESHSNAQNQKQFENVPITPKTTITSHSSTHTQKHLENVPKTGFEGQVTNDYYTEYDEMFDQSKVNLNKQKDTNNNKPTGKPIPAGSHSINKHTTHVEIGQQTEDDSQLTQLTEDVFGNNKNQAQIGQNTEDDSDLVQVVDDNFGQPKIGSQTGYNKLNIQQNKHDSHLTQQTEDDFGQLQIGSQNKPHNKVQIGQQTEDDSDLTQQTQDAFSKFELAPIPAGSHSINKHTTHVEIGQQTEDDSQLTQQTEDAFSKFQLGQQTEDDSQLTQQTEDAFSKFQLGQQTEDDSQLTQKTEDVFGKLHLGSQSHVGKQTEDQTSDGLGKLQLDSHQQHQTDLSQHAEDLTQQVQKVEDDGFGTFELGSHQRGHHQHSGSSSYQSSHSSSYGTHYATQQAENPPSEISAHLDQQQVEKVFAVPTIHGASSSSNSYSSQTRISHPGQIATGIESDVELITETTTTQKPGFWKRVGSKIETSYGSAKDKAKSIFSG